MEQLHKTNKKRRVMIGSPCMYGDINVWYVNSLSNTIKMSFERDIEIVPIWLSYDALIQRVRNDTLYHAVQQEFDDLIWIDCDIEWDPEDFFKLLDYPVDIVGGTYRKKGDIEEYVLRPLPTTETFPGTNLQSVHGLGTGFVRMSYKACKYLIDNSPKYFDDKDKIMKSMAFNVVVDDTKSPPVVVSEDLVAFDTLVKGGFKVWFDPEITCNHIGPYKFQGSYKDWSNRPAHERLQRVKTAPAITRTVNQLPKINRQL